MLEFNYQMNQNEAKLSRNYITLLDTKYRKEQNQIRYIFVRWYDRIEWYFTISKFRFSYIF